MHFIQMTLMRQQNSHKVKNVPLIICLFLNFYPCLTLAQSTTPKSPNQLVSEIYATTDAAKKANLLSQLSKSKPQSPLDVEQLVSVSRTSSEKSIKESALNALSKVTPEDKEKVSTAYIKALDEKDWQIRGTVITALGKMKAIEAAPKLRSILMEKPRKDELKILKTTADNDKKYSWMLLSSPGLAARALGEIRDEEAIPLLVRKYDKLGEAATESLASIGKAAVPDLIKLAQQEKGKSENPATMALGQIKDKSAKEDLIQIFKIEKDYEIRFTVMNSLVSFMQGDDVFDVIKTVYAKERDPLLIMGIKTKNGVPFLIDILKTETSYDAREAAIVMLERIGDKSAVPALEESLHDESKNIRLRSAHALKTLTGKNYR